MRPLRLALWLGTVAGGGSGGGIDDRWGLLVVNRGYLIASRGLRIDQVRERIGFARRGLRESAGDGGGRAGGVRLLEFRPGDGRFGHGDFFCFCLHGLYFFIVLSSSGSDCRIQVS
jgi:hypothetical protein